MKDTTNTGMEPDWRDVHAFTDHAPSVDLAPTDTKPGLKRFSMEPHKELEPPDSAEKIPEPCFRGVFDDYRKALAETTEASDNYHFLALKG